MPSIARRFRRRFGISAPRMAVRTQIAWYWRWLAMAAFAGVSLAIAAWIYDAGRRFAGFDRSELEQERDRLRGAVEKLDNENLRLSNIVSAGDARVKIEQAAQAQLASQVKVLDEENRRLKEDLAFFENLSPTADKLTIDRFSVRPDILPGEYRYRLLVVMGGKRDRLFQGSLQLVLNVQLPGRNGMIVLPDTAQPESSDFKLSFKYFQRVEGTFRLPDQARLRAVQARVFENGASQARATQNLDMS
jgi:hypothetical protein